MHKKMLYTAPEAQLLVVHSEGLVCASGNFGIGGFENDPNPLSADPLSLDANSILGMPGGMGLSL